MIEEKFMPCPKCEQPVKCLVYPRMLVTRYARAASNKKAMNYFKDERWIPKENCLNCKITCSEMLQLLRNRKGLSASRAAQKAVEAGLPTVF